MIEDCHRAAPSANLKCIAFTAKLALGYWFLPRRNKWVLAAIIYGAYIAMAWYDYWFQCKRSLGPTYLMSFYEWAKPPEGSQRRLYDSWCPDMKRHIKLLDLGIALILLGFLPDFLKWKPS